MEPLRLCYPFACKTEKEGIGPSLVVSISHDAVLYYCLSVHTGAGYYAYIETSSPRVLGDKARLKSGPIAANSQYCLEFWYHMFGPDIDTFSVYLSAGGTSTLVNCSRTHPPCSHNYVDGVNRGKPIVLLLSIL